jgi:hypothetical protein
MSALLAFALAVGLFHYGRKQPDPDLLAHAEVDA